MHISYIAWICSGMLWHHYEWSPRPYLGTLWDIAFGGVIGEGRMTKNPFVRKCVCDRRDALENQRLACIRLVQTVAERIRHLGRRSRYAWKCMCRFLVLFVLVLHVSCLVRIRFAFLFVHVFGSATTTRRANRH